MGTITKQHHLLDLLKKGETECFDDLYNYYHYIAEKFYNKYEGKKKEKAKLLAEKILKNAIMEYAEKVVPGTNYLISKFIHNKFCFFDKKLDDSPTLNDLTKQAYKGDRQAKIELLNKYKYLIDKYILRMLNMIKSYYNDYILKMNGYAYLDDDFKYPNNFISNDDICQDYYLKTWQLINNYYDNNIKTKFLSIYLSRQLDSFTNSYFKNIKNEVLKISIETCIDINSYFFEDCVTNLENEFINDKIESYLSGTLQLAYHELRKGKTHQQVADELGISRSRVSDCIQKSQEIVKRKGIKR